MRPERPPLLLGENIPAGGSDAGPHADRAVEVAALNARFRHHGATAVLRAALREGVAGRIAMVSSFGAESIALLHLVAVAEPATPVLFLDTRLLFPETLAYQRDVARRLGLRDVRVLKTPQTRLHEADPYGALRFSDPDSCCALRKSEPLEAALAGFDGWITGRKRYQSAGRATLDFFELDPASGRIKVNPLAYWRAGDVRAYIEENRLPRHPLVAKGYPSIGCAPCTSRVADGESPRAGRWRGQDKDECGIHFANGKPRRQSA
jgi:phosphoadenosine phosphosulfate reductase